MANVSDETKLENAWLAYTADNWSTSTSVDMDETQNGTYKATVSRQSAGTFVKYKVLAVDAAENQAEGSGNYSVKNPTQIEISLSKYICNVDETVSVDGSISHGGALITLNYTCTNTEVLRSTRADSNGIFSDLYRLANFGIWTISASWQGNETCFGAASNSESLAVSKIFPSLTCNVTARFLNLGEKILVNGSISPSMPLAQIRIVFTRHNGSTVETSEYTSVNGTFGTEFTPDSAGPWEVAAKFSGDNIRYGASQSYPTSFVVEEKSIFNLEFFIYIGVAGATGAVALITVVRMRRGRGEV